MWQNTSKELVHSSRQRQTKRRRQRESHTDNQTEGRREEGRERERVRERTQTQKLYFTKIVVQVQSKPSNFSPL